MSRKAKARRAKTAKTPRRGRIGRVLLGLGPLVAVVAAVGAIVAVLVLGQMGGGDESVAPVAESTPAGGGEASYQGGPRMRFAVESVDFGRVPLNTTASYAFEFTNVGDATLQISDVEVKMLEGC